MLTLEPPMPSHVRMLRCHRGSNGSNFPLLHALVASGFAYNQPKKSTQLGGSNASTAIAATEFLSPTSRDCGAWKKNDNVLPAAAHTSVERATAIKQRSLQQDDQAKNLNNTRSL
jgi:hypothetical protein